MKGGVYRMLTLGSVLSDHLERYQHIINEIYNQEATQKPIEWKK